MKKTKEQTSKSNPALPEILDLSEKKSEGEAKKKFRRGHWLIDFRFQAQYMFEILLLTLLGGAMGSCLVLYFALGVSESQGPMVEQIVLEALPRTALKFMLISAILVPLMGLFLSHRIAGPAYRFRQSFLRMIQGDLNFRIHLRRLDHFKPLAQTFNETLETLRKREAKEKRTKAKAQEKIEETLAHLKEPTEENLPESLRLLEEAVALLDGSETAEDEGSR